MSRDDAQIETRIQAHALGRLSAQDSADLAAQARDDPPLHAELALAEALVRARADDPARQQSVAFGWARLSRAIDADRATLPRAGRWPTPLTRWQAAAAALLAVAVWQFAAERPWPGDAGYGMAGAPAAQAFVAQVAFKPQATELQRRAALLAAGARVVGGPSALGLYRLAFADAAALQAGVARLRAETAVVESIQADEPAAGRAVPP
ncbi:hypothetical protein [Aquabacterium sp. OR-4]|uniref:hypothetical protein n=1 Tax=Aquabacterium sp. OR-4 TaxID=2978127 RepID=UPI0021B42ED5|nr:hypothetical protein [Aquabacterium sp. OR-4]MDT7838186.1 hypothetical protein [Aquabacterium sp. OR-4]